MNSKTVARHGLLVGLALVLSWAEAQIPAFFALPGMKLGITNLVVLAALYLFGAKNALLVNLLRIGLVALLFGNGAALAYSLAGGLLSWLAMVGLKATGRFGITAVSAVGGICHNIGQLLVAMVLLGTGALAWYLCLLWFSGLIGGLAIGWLGGVVCERIQHHL